MYFVRSYFGFGSACLSLYRKLNPFKSVVLVTAGITNRSWVNFSQAPYNPFEGTSLRPRRQCPNSCWLLPIWLMSRTQFVCTARLCNAAPNGRPYIQLHSVPVFGPCLCVHMRIGTVRAVVTACVLSLYEVENIATPVLCPL